MRISLRILFTLIVFFSISASSSKFQISGRNKIFCRKESDKTISNEEFKKCLARFLQDEVVRI